MKKIAALTLALCVAASAVCADEFTDMVQALGVKAAAVGTYDASRVNVDYEIKDYYSPQMWAERYAAEYGSIAGERTFLGVCADFTMYAYNDIKANMRKYNKAGMNGDEFYIASVKYDTNSIEIQKTTTREGATVFENGVYMTYYYNNVPVKKYGVKNIWTHKEWDEKRAVNHAWIWIQRDDGVWFWVDPTWTDNLGYVVWGCIRNGEEILLKPEPKFCVKWDERYLDSRPDPPPQGPKIQPAYVAQTQKPQAQKPSASGQRPSSTSTRRPSSSSTSTSRSQGRGYPSALSVGFSKPIGDFTGGNYIGSSFWDTVGGVSLSLEAGNSYSTIFMLQLDYYNLDKKSLLFDFGIGKQMGKVFALYAGAGIGGGTTAEGIGDIGLDNISFAWKAFAGARLTFGRLSLRADVSYVGDSGVVLGAFVGLMF